MCIVGQPADTIRDSETGGPHRERQWKMEKEMSVGRWERRSSSTGGMARKEKQTERKTEGSWWEKTDVWREEDRRRWRDGWKAKIHFLCRYKELGGGEAMLRLANSFHISCVTNTRTHTQCELSVCFQSWNTASLQPAILQAWTADVTRRAKSGEKDRSQNQVMWDEWFQHRRKYNMIL